MTESRFKMCCIHFLKSAVFTAVSCFHKELLAAKKESLVILVEDKIRPLLVAAAISEGVETLG